MSPLRALVVLALLSSASSAEATKPMVEVTTCGQAVPRGTVGYLTGDLDCTGFEDLPGAVLLSQAATLELRGFRVTGGIMNVICGEMRTKAGVTNLYSVQHCAVVGGGGTLSAAEAHGISGDRLTVSDLTIENAGQEGLFANRKGRITDVVITGSGGSGMWALGSMFIVGTTISGSGAQGIFATSSLRIVSSTVLGNGVGGSCSPSRPCLDILSEKRPRVVDTQCGTSGVSDRYPYNWGICASD